MIFLYKEMFKFLINSITKTFLIHFDDISYLVILHDIFLFIYVINHWIHSMSGHNVGGGRESFF